VMTSITDEMTDDCASQETTCNNFFELLKTQVLTNNAPTNQIKLNLKNFCINTRITMTNCKKYMTDLGDNYQELKTSKMVISKKVKGAIKSIQDYINKSGIPLTVDISTINSSASVFQELPTDDGDGESDSINWDDDESETNESKTDKIDSDEASNISYGVDIDGNQIEGSDDGNQSLNSQIKQFIENQEKLDDNSSDGIDESQTEDSVIQQLSLEALSQKLKVNRNKFNQNLVWEQDSLLKLQFMIASGRVNPELLDLSQLPSANIQFIEANKMETS